jgi:hypothetical protein
MGVKWILFCQAVASSFDVPYWKFDVERSTFDVRRACGVGKSQGLKVKGRRERAAAPPSPLLYDFQTFDFQTFRRRRLFLFFRPSDAADSSSSFARGESDSEINP